MIRWSRLLLAAAAAGLGAWGAGGPARAACTLGKLAELPVTMVGSKPTVPVKINGEELQFLADSGAFYSLMPAAVAAQFKLFTYSAPPGFYLVGSNGDAQVDLTRVKHFTIAGADLPNIEFMVGGSAVPGVGGVVGQNVLHISDVEYDLASGVLRLIRPHGCGGAELAYWAKDKAVSMIPIAAMDGPKLQAVGTVVVNGARLHAMFDTGAGSTVLTLAGARRAGLDVNGPGAAPDGYSTGIGRGLQRSWIVPVAKLELGSEQIRNTKLRVSDTTLGGDNDMLLGADFFLSHRVYVANSQNRVYFTYNGGPVFNLARDPDPSPAARLAVAAAPAAAPGGAPAATPPPPPGTPTDAEGFSRRGAAFAARRDFAHAIEDDDRAVALAPGEARYLRQRAVARLALRQPFLAMADLDAVLKLAPDDAQARVMRASLRLGGHDLAGAQADLEAADRALPKQSDLRLAMGQLYGGLDLFEAALAQYDLWIAVHREDVRLGQAMNGRCWARDLLNRDLDKALSDCNAAVRLLPPRTPGALDSRGLAHLRRGEWDRAIADYDAALRIDPRLAWSLYGRGVAETRKGLAAQGQADIAAAAAANPRLPDLARRFGVTP